MASTMQLEFTQAMADFKIMFPDMDRDVIEAVLRANQGAVDASIDQLLAMSTDNQNEKLRNELEAKQQPSPQRSLIQLNDDCDTDVPTTNTLIDTTDGGNTSTTTTCTIPAASQPGSQTAAAAAANAALLNLSGGGGGGSSPLLNNTGASPKQRPLTNSTPVKQRGGAVLVGAARRWNPPMLGPLPPGFLRITPPATALDASAALVVAGRESDLPDDEQFALMLQNEEFMHQLRWNQEFMTALEREQCGGKGKGEDDAAFKERLRHMGKVSRKKFVQMARVFTWQRNKKTTTAKQIDSLPLKEEPSDDEDHHHNHQQQQQQAQLQQQPHSQLQGGRK